MIGLNMILMMVNAYRGDLADEQRLWYCWGWSRSALRVRWRELGGRLIRPWKWHKVWHSFKHLVIEWVRLDANRAGKVFLDLIFWAVLLGVLF